MLPDLTSEEATGLAWECGGPHQSTHARGALAAQPSGAPQSALCPPLRWEVGFCRDAGSREGASHSLEIELRAWQLLIRVPLKAVSPPHSGEHCACVNGSLCLSSNYPEDSLDPSVCAT